MRLIRSAPRTANISLSYQLRSRRVLEPSNESLNPDMQNGFNTWRRGRSYAAAVPSNTPRDEYAGRKVPKKRQTMVVKYVNRYRSMQGGKFPTNSEILDHVGGSYYIIKRVIDELKYKSKNLSPDEIVSLSVEHDAMETGEVETGKVSQSQETGEFVNHVENELSTQSVEGKAEGAINIQTDVDAPISQTRTSETVTESLQSEEAPQSAKSVREYEARPPVVDAPISQTRTSETVTESLQSEEAPQSAKSVRETEAWPPVNDKQEDINTDETKQSLHAHPVINIKHEKPPVDKVKYSEHAKAEQQRSTESHTLRRESEKEGSENGPEKKSSVWQNLKSFASGIFGKWR